MESTTRTKVAATTTIIAIAGLAGAGIALRNESEPAVATNAAADKARPVVIHRKRVRRVPVKLPGASGAAAGAVQSTGSVQPAPTAGSTAAPTTVVAAPAQPAVSVPAPEPVSSRTSPSGAGAGDDGSEHEADRGEHEGGD
jgi:hypothetical protein